MLEQYRQIKREHQDEVLFFRLGDFYEMFFEDALEVSALLNLTLTSRAGQPMCGVPYHASRSYISRLLKAGKKIAICEQLSEPGKGLIDRKVTEIITPGTTVDEDFLEKGSSNYLACLAGSAGGMAAGLGGFAGAMGGFIAPLFIGFALEGAGVDGYVIPFTVAAFGYFIALGIIQLLLPKIQPVKI